MSTICIGKEIRKKTTLRLYGYTTLAVPIMSLGERNSVKINAAICHFIAISRNTWKPYLSWTDYKPQKYTRYISHRKVFACLADLQQALSYGNSGGLCVAKGGRGGWKEGFYFSPREDIYIHKVCVCMYVCIYIYIFIIIIIFNLSNISQKFSARVREAEKGGSTVWKHYQ